MLTKSCLKVAQINTCKYNCENCHYYTNKKSSYDKHLSTSKHATLTVNNIKNADKSSDHICIKCDKVYKSRVGLWSHKKKCSKKQEEIKMDIKIENNDNVTNDKLLIELIKQNQDFKELMMEQNKQNQELQKHMIELAKNAGHNNSNNTTNNTKFNLQFFLNDTCKDAMNITDFVNSLVLDFEDLENMGHLGYVEGIRRIFLRGIRGMDVTKRPFHCSDIKRETMFVKELEGWEKENSDNEKMTMTIKRIACKNLRQATAWMAAHQKAIADTDSKPHSQYMKMMSQCLGGATAAEDKSNYNKIIRRVAQEVFIDKK